VRTLRFDGGRFLTAEGERPAAVPAQGLPTMEFYRQQILLGLKDYARRCGFTQVVVGSSGGIDSALTLALAAQALGPENVVGITMPSRFSSSGSVDDSVALCRNLGVQLLTHPIADLVAAYARQYEASFGQPLQGLPLENLQARIRGTVLMEYSNAFGHLLLTTGNKSEISVGYCTLYGDTNGGLGLIGDLYKTEVFAARADSPSHHRQGTVGRARAGSARCGQPAALPGARRNPEAAHRRRPPGARRARRRHHPGGAARRNRGGCRPYETRARDGRAQRIQAPPSAAHPAAAAPRVW
jgi:hypothetical protein